MQNKSSLSTPPFSYILSPRHLQDSSIIFHQHILPNNYYFYYTDDMDFAYLAKDDTYVLIYGLCIDIQNNTLQNKEICSILSDSLLNGKERFYDAIDMLSGRFIIIYGYNKEYFILSDACGMLKITYDYENKAISNNIFLIDDYFRNKKREYRDNFNTKSFHQGCLGNLQPLKGMKILTPNHELDLNSFSINRFYPRKPIAPSSDTEAVSNRICHYIQVQEKLLSSQYHLL